MTSSWRVLGNILRQDGVTDCRVVNADGKKDPRCTNEHSQGHHGCFPGMQSEKRAKYRRFLDHAINYAPACYNCNVQYRVGDPRDARVQFFKQQLDRYGSAQCKAWLQSAPQEIRERREWQLMYDLASERN